MIHYLVTRAHSYTLQWYLDSWGRDLRPLIRTVHYEDAAFWKTAPTGVYIFSDIERLHAPQRRLFGSLADQLAAAGCCVLNHPQNVRRRFELLKSLASEGLNNFRVYELEEASNVRRFPVFLRKADEHEGSETELIHDSATLGRAIESIRPGERTRFEWLIVEYLDTSVDGQFRKYSSMRIGPAMIPRHVLFSGQWIVKTPENPTSEHLLAESDYVTTGPHSDLLLRIFDLAKIQYGRIDYALLDGRIQTWEINTNPVVMPLPKKLHPDRESLQLQSAKMIEAGFRTIAGSTLPSGQIPIRFDDEAMNAAGFGLGRRVAWFARKLRGRLKRMLGPR